MESLLISNKLLEQGDALLQKFEFCQQLSLEVFGGDGYIDNGATGYRLTEMHSKEYLKEHAAAHLKDGHGLKT